MGKFGGNPGDVLAPLYAVGRDDEAWVGGIARALAPRWSRGAGVMAWTFRASETALRTGAVGVAGVVERRARVFRALPERFASAFGPARSASAYGTPRAIVSGRDAYGAHPFERLCPPGVRDFLGTIAVDEDGRGLMLGTPTPRPGKTSPRDHRLAAIVADHARSALRLRRLVGAWRAGGVRSASAPASAGPWELAEEFARVLLAGGLSLVARRPTPTGSSFLWAHLPGASSERSLSPRQRRIVAWLQAGWSGKQIAMSLDISQSTVSRELDEVSWKLGLRSSGDVAGTLAALASLTADPTTAAEPSAGPIAHRIAHLRGRELDLWALTLDAAPRALTQLTPAERAVALAVARGEHPDEVARARSVSRRTLANQLQRTYRKLRVQTRDELAVLLRAGPDALTG